MYCQHQEILKGNIILPKVTQLQKVVVSISADAFWYFETKGWKHTGLSFIVDV